MALDLYAGVPVSDFDTAVEWYARFFGAPASFLAGDTEAVWELAEHRAVAVELRPDRAGNALNTLFVDDFAMRLERIALAGIQPVVKETYPNGVRHATFRDPDGNEFSLSGAPE